MSPERARARFAAARIARLATVGATGRPRVVPIVFVVAGDQVYSAVDDKPKRTRALGRLADVSVNPAVSVLVDHYEEDWSALWWVRADGTARILDPGAAETERAHGLLAARYPQQQGAGTVLAVTVQRWLGWEAAVR